MVSQFLINYAPHESPEQISWDSRSPNKTGNNVVFIFEQPYVADSIGIEGHIFARQSALLVAHTRNTITNEAFAFILG